MNRYSTELTERLGLENGGDDLPQWAWPGGYQIAYVTADGGILCHACATQADVDYNDPNDPQWFIYDIQVLEGDLEEDHGNLTCDHCYRMFEE